MRMTETCDNVGDYFSKKMKEKKNKDEDGDDGRGVVFSPKLVGSCLEPVTDPDGSCSWEVGPTPHLDSCSRNGGPEMTK